MNIKQKSINPAIDVAYRRCAEGLPVDGAKYYLLFSCENHVISYYSKGVAWEDENEIRVARLVKAFNVVQFYRNKNVPCLILENTGDLIMWCAEWGCHALVPKRVWDGFNNNE